jgi:hypothetical protein
MPAGDGSIGVELTARQWATIDADMDNAVSDAIDAGDDRSAELGTAIRKAGWDQVPWVEGDWPLMEQVITITLSAAQWQFVTGQLVRSTPTYERLGDQESLDLARSALDRLLPQLPP